MNFSAWSIRNPVAPILLFVMLMVLGWTSFTSLPITRFPNIDVPLVAVTVTQAGAAPAELESQVTKEIEDAVTGIAGVKNVTSTVAEGVSTTVVEFDMAVPTDKAVQDVKDAVDRITGDLPAEADAPSVTRIDIEGQAIMTFAVSSPGMTIEELSWFVDDTIARELQGEGIGRVTRYGGADREIRVELDPVRLGSFGITAAAVSQQLRATNADIGAGRAEVGGTEQAIRALGDAATAGQLAETTISLPSGRFVRLGELGDVIDSYEDLRSFSRLNGEPVVTFAVFRAKGASEVSAAEEVTAALDLLRAAHPDVQIVKVDDTVGYTYGNYDAAIKTLIEGAILAVLVVLAFLRNWRATLIAAVALPLSAVPTFWVMDLLGFSLNIVSFMAITLATGILVDDAIVEVENISRHIHMGKSPYRAAIEAADEIGLAVIATSFTIAAVFVPVSFLGGIPGQYFTQFGLTVGVSVLFSLLVARLITPMMAAYLMRARDAHAEGTGTGPLMRAYVAVVGATMRMRYLTLLAAAGILAVSLHFLLQVPGSFLPPEDVSRFAISVELPPGSLLADTDRTTEQMREVIAGVEGVRDVLVLGGTTPTGDLALRLATVTVLLDPLDHGLVNRLWDMVHRIPGIGTLVPEPPREGRQTPQREIEAEIMRRLAAVPDIRAFKLNDRGMRDITYSVLSSDAASLNEAVARLESALRGDPLLADVSSEGALPRPEIQIVPRRDEAARLGVTTSAMAQTLRVATIGDFDAALAKVSIDDRLIPVRVQLADEVRGDIARLGALRVPTGTGATVPLDAVADLFLSEGPATIERHNRERQATIGATLPPGVALGTATARFLEIAQGVDLPPGVRLAEAGDAEVRAEMQQSFGNAMIFGLMLVLAVLILLFKSVMQPLTILLSLPLAIGGVAAGLILSGNPLSMPVLIGILMLMGIVTKNAILLVDFAIEMRRHGLDRFTAMVEAGRKRARPIVMTSIAMSAGMLPSALGVGEGGEFRAPMAIAVIGGIVVSTVLSLVVVPSFFLIMDDLSRLLGGSIGRLIGPRDEAPPDPTVAELAARIDGHGAEIASLRDRVAGGAAPPVAAE
ncbi:MAG: efflux RND transporter permease subunit [Rubellimicrobium sp.]|nr:efflux RND transporter permease subunit [Rubellimicrobium sp.]